MVSAKLLKVDRQLMILDLLHKKGSSLRIAELSVELNVSVVTVRRDVWELARQGIVASTRGGVKLLHEGATYEPRYETKLSEDTDIKDAIARHVAECVDDGATIFLDGGTTVGSLAHYLARKQVTVVTNALNVANVLASSKSVRLILVGGTFRQTSQTFLGPKAVRALEELRFDVAFMGTEGFDPARGAEVPDESDAEFKARAIQLAREVVLLSTASKLNKPRLYRFATWEDINQCVIAGDVPDEAVHEIESHGVEVVSLALRPSDVGVEETDG